MSQTRLIRYATSIMALLWSTHALCQESSPYARPLKPSDSILMRRYLDTVGSVSVFSVKRQRYLDSALALAPWKAAWWQQKAMPLFKQKKYSVGLPYLDSAVKYDVHRYIDYRAFMKCIFMKDYTGAIADFRSSKTVIGNSAVMDHSYDFYIGLCYLQLNNFDSAKIYFVKSISEQKASRGEKYVHPVDWFYLGITNYELDNYNEAIEALSNSITLYPNFSDAKYYKAICLERSHRHDESMVMLKEAGEDYKQGYTFNEDNAVYETYPYQVSKYYFR